MYFKWFVEMRTLFLSIVTSDVEISSHLLQSEVYRATPPSSEKQDSHQVKPAQTTESILTWKLINLI